MSLAPADSPAETPASPRIRRPQRCPVPPPMHAPASSTAAALGDTLEAAAGPSIPVASCNACHSASVRTPIATQRPSLRAIAVVGHAAVQRVARTHRIAPARRGQRQMPLQHHERIPGGDIDHDPAPIRCHFEQGADDSERAQGAAAQVVGVANIRGRRVGISRHPPEAAFGVEHAGIAGPIGIQRGGAEAGQREDDERRIAPRAAPRRPGPAVHGRRAGSSPRARGRPRPCPAEPGDPRGFFRSRTTDFLAWLRSMKRTEESRSASGIVLAAPEDVRPGSAIPPAPPQRRERPAVRSRTVRRPPTSGR